MIKYSYEDFKRIAKEENKKIDKIIFDAYLKEMTKEEKLIDLLNALIEITLYSEELDCSNKIFFKRILESICNKLKGKI